RFSRDWSSDVCSSDLDPGHGTTMLPSSAGVVAHGHVPDLAPLLDGCRIAVAPLRFGAGVKGKINLSQAHGQPVVATACAVEGMQIGRASCRGRVQVWV